MSRRAWSERRWLWLPMLLLVVLNLAALAWYFMVYSDFTRRVDQQLAEQRADLESLESTLASRRAAASRLERNVAGLAEFYDTRLAPASERLTEVIREVRTLARTAGLEPSSIAYPTDDFEEYDLVKRSFSFAVLGSYAQLRRLINLIEMTDSFLTLEAVQLAGRSSETELRITLQLATFFIEDESATERAGS